MTPSLKVRSCAAAFLLVACLATGCDSADQTVAADTSALTCGAGTFRLVGTIDDMSIDVMQPSNTGGFAQLEAGDFGSINNAFDPAATLTDLHVTWSSNVNVGATTAATATIKIPTSPFPEDTFCAGKGTTVSSLADTQGGGLRFHLSTLASGAGCATPRQGTLQACWTP